MIGESSTAKKSGYVARWIIAGIKEQRYKVGDRLPSERTIAERLNVSRTAVREALSSLQALGLVEPRVGEGNYVSGGVETEVDINEALQALQESESFVEVWQARKVIEVVIAKLAAQKATELDIVSLNDCLHAIEEAARKRDAEEYLSANNHFHLAIAEAGKNAFLRKALMPLLEITTHQLSKEATGEYIAAHIDDLVDKHREIVTALAEHDDKGIVGIMRAHFAASEKIFLEH